MAFLLRQFFQTAQGYSPLGAGLRILPWTLMPMFVAPIAGALSDRIGGRPLMATGLALQAVGLAWIAAIFVRYGGYESPETFADGIVPALWVGAAVLAAGSLVSLLIPRQRPADTVPVVEHDGDLVPHLEPA